MGVLRAELLHQRRHAPANVKSPTFSPKPAQPPAAAGKPANQAKGNKSFRGKGPKKGGGGTRASRGPDLARAIPCCEPPLTVGGRLQHFCDFWIDHFQLEAMVEGVLKEGYKIPFQALPQFRGIRQTPLVGEYAHVLLEEVDSLLAKGAIEPVVSDQAMGGFYSTYFLVPKKTGDLRPILNLKPINGQIKRPSFKMETVASVMKALKVGDWMASLDLKDAYFHVPIYPGHRQYLRFCIQDRCYQYKVLPFGLTTSPRTFTKVLAPVIAYLHSRGILAFPYLDDILFSAKSEVKLASQMELVKQVFNQAGFIINVQKSSMTPSQDMVFIGARIQSLKNLVSLPPERAVKVAVLAKSFVVGQDLLSQGVAHSVGSDGSHSGSDKTCQVTYETNPNVRSLPLEQVRSRARLPAGGQPSSPRLHIQWWTDQSHLLSGLPLCPQRHRL